MTKPQEHNEERADRAERDERELDAEIVKDLKLDEEDADQIRGGTLAASASIRTRR